MRSGLSPERRVGRDEDGECSLSALKDRLSVDLASVDFFRTNRLSYGPPWAHYLGGYQDRLLGGPLGLLVLFHTTPDGVGCKDYGREVLG
jgi:hypothetical protein